MDEIRGGWSTICEDQKDSQSDPQESNIDILTTYLYYYF